MHWEHTGVPQFADIAYRGQNRGDSARDSGRGDVNGA